MFGLIEEKNTEIEKLKKKVANLKKKNKLMIEILFDVAKGTHKSKKLYDWYIGFIKNKDRKK